MRFFFARLLPVSALTAGLFLQAALASATHPPSRSDAQIAAALHAKLAKSKEAKDGFRFQVQGGVVTWEGLTHVPQHKGAATRMAKSAGARAVVNHIAVAGSRRDHSSPKTRLKAPATDAQIESALRAKLAKSKIGKDGFRFRVQNGVVTWEGVAHVAQHKGAATRMAKAAGAREVINNILVSSGKETHGGSGLKRAKVEW
ncbi:MAG TPA: BON domain-containing protein [Bryobacteraceae bacterium]